MHRIRYLSDGTEGSLFLWAIAGTAVGYLDDLYAILLDDVQLTVTPATQLNSTEPSPAALRVDGLDVLSQSVRVPAEVRAASGSLPLRLHPTPQRRGGR